MPQLSLNLISYLLTGHITKIFDIVNLSSVAISFFFVYNSKLLMNNFHIVLIAIIFNISPPLIKIEMQHSHNKNKNKNKN